MSFQTKAIYKKLHTCHANYSLWKKRIDEVNEGKAILVIYEWTDKPYNSITNKLFVFGNKNTAGFIDTLKTEVFRCGRRI